MFGVLTFDVFNIVLVALLIWKAVWRRVVVRWVSDKGAAALGLPVKSRSDGTVAMLE